MFIHLNDFNSPMSSLNFNDTTLRKIIFLLQNYCLLYRLKKSHKIIIYCLLTNKISVFFLMLDYFLIVFLKRVASFLREII